MDLRQLKYFLRIVELGNLSRAADSLHVAQSALSRHVANMESELGRPLLLRTRRGVEPTESGRALIGYAQAMLRLGSDARGAVTAAGAGLAGPVAVGFPLSLTEALALPLVAWTREQHPRLVLQVFDQISGDLADQLRGGQLHLAVLFDSANLAGLDWEPVLQERLFLAVAPGSAWAHEHAISLARLADVPLAIPGVAHGVRAVVARALDEAGLSLSLAVEANSMTVMTRFAASGLGGAIVSSASVAGAVDSGALTLIEVDHPGFVRRAGVAVTPARPQPVAVQPLARRLAVIARELAARGRWRDCMPVDQPSDLPQRPTR